MTPNPDRPQGPDTAAIASARSQTYTAPDQSVRAESNGRVRVGSVLNHIYRVTGFLAQGGMGEVYEGVNVNTDERVAIKVILPHLAEDPKIQAMFRKEAQTLTRLTHTALVQYRVLAQEPVLGVFYIVTEFVDGQGLDELIGEVTPPEEELRSLMRRLADGLRAAHELGAIHLDISPDNILLPDGRLEAAKIIDFGIARDRDASKGTLLGEAFGGKLGYVAPEQLGDFGRDIGPWTDVYSLGLVILALAAGGSLDMGITPAEAIDRRRAGPDLSALPADLRPVLGRMLEPDPSHRLRSMDSVIEALDEEAQNQTPPVEISSPRRSPILLLTALSVGLLAVAGVALFELKPLLSPRPAAAVAPVPPEAALNDALRAAPCAWMSDRMSRGPDGLHIELSGAAGDPARAAASVVSALNRAGSKVAIVDHSQLRILPPAACEAVSAIARLHAASSETTWLRAQASVFHQLPSPLCHDDPLQAVSVVTLRPPTQSNGDDVGLLRVDDSGAVSRVFSGLAEFKAMAQARENGRGYRFEDLGSQGLRVSLCETGAGVRGFAMIRGKPPFDLGLRPTPASGPAVQAASPDWITAAGKAQNWRTQMAWYEVDHSDLLSSRPSAGTAAARAALKAAHRPRAVVDYSAKPQPPPPPKQPDRHDTLGTDFK